MERKPLMVNEDQKAASSSVAASFTTEQHATSAPDPWRGQPFYGYLAEAGWVILALCLVALGILVVTLDGQRQSGYGEKVVQITLTIPTFWPIIFAAILGHAVKTWANYSVERGTKLSHLEALMGSQTLGNTLQTILFNRALTAATLLLLLCWAFSPLGSQAILRAMTTENPTNTSRLDVQYLNLSLFDLRQSGAMAGPSSFNTMKNDWGQLYSSFLRSRSAGLEATNYTGTVDIFDANTNNTLSTDWEADFQTLVLSLGGTENAAVAAAEDDWGNILIPNIERLPGYSAGSGHWFDVPWRTQVVDHASLVGIPIRGIPNNMVGNVTFVSNHVYYSLHCNEWNSTDLNLTHPSIPWIKDHWRELQYHGPNSTFASQYNLTEIDPSSMNDTESWTVIRAMVPLTGNGFFIDTPDPYVAISHVGDPVYGCANTTGRRVYFGSIGHIQTHFTQCTMRSVPVSSRIFCEARGRNDKLRCGVEAMLERPDDQICPGGGRYATPFDDGKLGNYTAQAWPSLTNLGLVHLQSFTLTETFLFNPARVDLGGIFNNGMELGKVPSDIFSSRLTLAFNAMLQTSMWGPDVTGSSMDRNLTGSAFTSFITNLTPQNETADSVFFLEPTYRVSRLWITLYFVSAAVILAAALVSFLLKLRCDAPELLGFVSTLARNNEFFRLRGVESQGTAAGYDVGPQVRNTVVCIGDVRAGDGVGRIAFAPADIASKIEKGRKYQ